MAKLNARGSRVLAELTTERTYRDRPTVAREKWVLRSDGKVLSRLVYVLNRITGERTDFPDGYTIYGTAMAWVDAPAKMRSFLVKRGHAVVS